MLEIRGMREPEAGLVSAYLREKGIKNADIGGLLAEFPQYRVMVGLEGTAVLAALVYRADFELSGWRRGLSVDFASFSGPLAGELERCAVSVLIQKALREGQAYIICAARESGFMAERFEKRGEALYLEVFQNGWTVLQEANRCHGCH